MPGRLDTLLGSPGAPGGQPSDERAQTLLDRLKYGHNLGFACGLPYLTASQWARVTVLQRMPTSTGSTTEREPLPFERLAMTLAGLDCTFDISLAADRGELTVAIGFGSVDELERARHIMAPGTRLERIPTPAVDMSCAIGIAHRLQPVVGGPATAPHAVVPLLDALESVTGSGAVLLHCMSSSLTDLLGTTRALDALTSEVADELTTVTQLTDTTSTTVTSPRWQRVAHWTDAIARLLAQGAAIGLWAVDTWAVSSEPATARLLASALHAAIPADEGRWYETLDYDEPEAGDPAPTSVLTSRDIGELLRPPAGGRPGLAVRLAPPAGRRPVSGGGITLGSYQGTRLPASLAVTDLEGHAFVTGTTGSGKSTTLHRILAGLWNEHRIPFLVLDPVKDDYSPVAAAFDGGIRLVRGADLHLNLLEAWPSEDQRTHISQVAAAFRGAFTMPSPTPYVVTQLFDRVAMLPSRGSGLSLFDVRDMVPSLIDSLGYAPEQTSNIRAALMTRLNLLLAPARAHRFSWTDSSMVQQLFTQPTVVTLGDLADDEERSFIVLLLALATWARAKSRGGMSAVDHVLVLEEAHRILPEIDERIANPEIGSAKQVSTNLLSAMMAEVRSYGEQIIVVDQSPAQVSSSVVRNTNAKIAHRTVHPDDQDQVAGMLGLAVDDRAVLGELERGVAIYTTRTEPSAQTVAIARLDPRPAPGTAVSGSAAPSTGVLAVAPPPAHWPCGADNGEQHYRAWQDGAEAAHSMALLVAGVRWGDGDGRKLRERVYRGLLTTAGGDQSRTDCLAWSGLRYLTARRRRLGPHTGPYTADALLGELYQCWSMRLPLTRTLAGGSVADPPVPRALIDAAYLSWEEESVADALISIEPRNGIRMLATPGWRNSLPDVVDYLKRLRDGWEPLLGVGADALARILTIRAVRGANLSTDVIALLISRASLRATTSA